MGSLLIHLEDVKEAPRRFRLECDRAAWERVRELVHEPEIRCLQPLALELQGHRLGLRLLFRGQLSGALELSCSRCLTAYSFPVEETVELLLEPARAGQEVGEGGIELDATEPGLGRYAGTALDFKPVVVETLALVWPMQPLCTESCRGLCPICGVDRNREHCGCESAEKTTPFRELGKLLAEKGRKRR